MPKIDLAAVPVREGSGYPAPFDAPCATRTRRRIGDAGGARHCCGQVIAQPFPRAQAMAII